MKVMDQHVHTEFSPDSNQKIVGLIRRAKELNLNRLVFTDHFEKDPTDFTEEEIIDYDVFTVHLNNLRRQYPELELRLGTELSYQPHIAEYLSMIVNKYPFDIVIASLHEGERKSFYQGHFFEGLTQEEAYEKYFKLLIDMVDEFDDFDVVGHIDYIMRYGDKEINDLNYYKHQNVIDELLIKIINKGKGIEVNTSGMTKYNLGYLHPQKDILIRYFELGGRVITIGSDAHDVKYFYGYIDETIEVLKEIGFTYISEFINRKEIKIKI